MADFSTSKKNIYTTDAHTYAEVLDELQEPLLPFFKQAFAAAIASAFVRSRRALTSNAPELRAQARRLSFKP